MRRATVGGRRHAKRAGNPNAALESMEARRLLSFAAHINFQPAGAVPSGYVADTGSAYGNRGNGFTYGWNATDNNTRIRNSPLSPDLRYDTFDHMQKGGTYSWSIAVPNGTYQVHLVSGDATAIDSVYKLDINGSVALSGTPTSANHWVEGTIAVAVTNGKIALTNDAGGSNNKIDFIDITPVAPPPPTNALIGANLDGNFDWGTSHIWTDAAKDFRQWGQVGAPWNPNPSLTFTADDYPLQDADTVSYLTDYPNGVYKLTWTGAGSVTAYGMATISNIVKTASGGSADVTVKHDNPDGTGGVMELGIRGNVASNPVRNIHLWEPGYGPGTINAGQIFNQDFLRRVEPFSSLRFMDWGGTNNSPVVNWSDRSQPTAMIQTLKGVDWEDIIALGNATKRDIWINIPVQATDAYVTQLAALVRDTLDPSLKVRFEYSNEVWNSAFQQFGYVVQQARANPLLTATDDYTRAAQQYAYRTKQIGDIFRTAFGPQSNRLIPVIAGQTSNAWWLSSGLSFLNSKFGAPSQYFKEMAIAPYVGADLPSTPPAGGWTPDTLFPALESFNSGTLVTWIKSTKAVADTYGLLMTAYEGGQSLTGDAFLSAAVKAAANADHRMYILYKDMMTVWRQNGGALYEEFSHIGGGWGLLDDMRQVGAPKWDAVMSMILQPGDATLDGKVDYSDFLILKANYGKSGMWWEQGNFDGDGVVDRKDLDLLYANLSGLTPAQQADVDAFRAAHP